MKPTLKHIAEHAGLSVSTVSRILRGKSKRNTENVKLVIETAQKLNYPLQANYSLDVYENSKVLFVALVTHFHTGEFYSSFYNGFDQAARETNFQVSLFNTESDPDVVIDFLQQLSFKSYDAAVLFLPMLSEDDYHKIKANAPDNFVLISAATVVNPVLDTISFDSYRGGHYVGKHFHDRGYKDVGVVMGTTNRNESLLRKSGFTDYVQHHSNMNLVWQFEGDYTIESGRQAYEEYKNLERKPRAIFLSNDYMTLGFMEFARRDGVRIPDDVALVGYDDLPICTYHYPSISSVHTNYKQLGLSAISMLKEKFKNNSDHQGLLNIVPVTLNARQSS